MTLTSEPKDYPNGDLSTFDRHRHEYTAGGGGLPAGIITLWSGSVASIPSGWYLCDGANGTPDLRDKFVLAAGGAANPGDSGGAANLTHSGTAVGDHVGVLAHDHDQMRHATATGALSGITTAPDTSSSNPQVLGPKTGSTGTGSSYVHAVTQPSAHADSRPPFYALAYIMKA